MITRDISLEDCILDLIDNSIDGAWKLEGGMPAGLSANADLSKYMIDIKIAAKQFSIVDNCGGISLRDAKDYAFTFGRKDGDDFENYSIGVYGIGMKRAVFKLGMNTTVTSTINTDSGLDAFKVVIDVKEWLTRKDVKNWDFKISSATPRTEAGVSIVVDNLTEGTATSFDDPAFQKRLRRIIARDYTIHLHYGLRIVLNGKPIVGWDIEMRSSSELMPQRTHYVDLVGNDPVSVEIVAGMAAPPPDDSADADEIDDDDAYGWYVVCNGRVVLAADKGEQSGWGTDGWPQWHGQYNGFIGLVLFTATNASLLPLTTTKRNVDVSSEVFRRARPKMRDVSRTWTAYTTLRKGDLEEAKAKEDPAAAISIFSIPANSTFVLPTLKAVPAAPKIRNTRISYAVEPKRFRELAIALGNINMSRANLGLKTFDRVYDEEVGS
ncbi:ATP-binding protein [Rhizobium leguminosarum]|nr:ATP-binding protein [Rhizobium leguminosarum]